jgi:hypothetical protein
MEARTEYPAGTLRELHARRWNIELHFAQIKTTLEMDVLRCQSPAMIEKELQIHLIAYNLVRALMRREAIQRISAYVTVGGYLLVITRARNENDPEGTMPWPLLHSELDAFADEGLQTVIFEDILDQYESPTRRFRVCYRKT